MTRWLAAVVFVAACAPQKSANVEAPRSSGPELRPFTWDDALVVGGESMGGPGITRAARVGQRLSVMMRDGAVWDARVDVVERCDETGPEPCQYVGVEYDDGRDPESQPSRWSQPGSACEDLEDIALLDARLAVVADTALPRLVPHTLEVRYANALCEGDEDAEHYALLRTCTSTGDDPVKNVPALRDALAHPRRVVTLRVADRTLHFITLSKVARPPSGRMSDVPETYETEFWIVEDDKVLHHERNEGGRDANEDTSCMLPLRYDTPWNVVESDGVVWVLTRASMLTFARWSLQPDGLTRKGEWTADIDALY